MRTSHQCYNSIYLFFKICIYWAPVRNRPRAYKEHVGKWNPWLCSLMAAILSSDISHPYPRNTNHAAYTTADAKYQLSCKQNKPDRYLGYTAETANITFPNEPNSFSSHHAPPLFSISVNEGNFHPRQPSKACLFPNVPHLAGHQHW